MQPRQSLISAASRVGEISQDVMSSVEQGSIEDKEFKVCVERYGCNSTNIITISVIVTETE